MRGSPLHPRATRPPANLGTAALLLLLAVLVSCQDDVPSPSVAPPAPAASASPAPAESTGPPDVFLRPGDVDLGVLGVNEQRQITLEFVNDSDVKVFVTGLKTGCSCVKPSMEQREVPPHSTAVVDVSVYANIRGSRRLKVTVLNTSRDHPEAAAYVRFGTMPSLTLDPPTVQFGPVWVGGTATRTVRVAATVPTGIDDPVIRPSLRDPLPVTIVAGEPRITPLNEWVREYEITFQFTLQADLPLGEFRTDVGFAGENFLADPIQMTGTVHDGYTLESPRLRFGVVGAGETREKSFLIHYHVDEPPTVESVESEPDLGAVATVDQEQRVIRIDTRFTAGEPGKVEGEIRLRSSLSPDPIVIPVNAQVR